MGCLFKYKYICIQELPKYADRKYENTDANRDMKRMETHQIMYACLEANTLMALMLENVTCLFLVRGSVYLCSQGDSIFS